MPVQTSGRSNLQAGLVDVYGRGRLSPVLRFTVNFSVSTGFQAELLHVKARVYCGEEYLGAGDIIGGWSTPEGRSANLEVPTSARLLDYVTNTLGSNGSLQLSVHWAGRIRVSAELAPDNASTSVKGDAEMWEETIHDSSPAVTFTVAHSDWYDRVLRPVRNEDYVYLEVAVPQGDAGAKWRQAIRGLEDAEKAFSFGDDPSVFLRLRAVLDALPGAKKNIFDSLEGLKAKRVDDLLKDVGEYLHLGRHVDEVGDGETGFPVDHLDAEFAIAQLKVILSYGSRLLARSAHG